MIPGIVRDVFFGAGSLSDLRRAAALALNLWVSWMTVLIMAWPWLGMPPEMFGRASEAGFPHWLVLYSTVVQIRILFGKEPF